MQEYQLRVIKERHELEDKCTALHAALNSVKFVIPADDRKLLEMQYNTMMTYKHMLDLRIERF